MDGANTRFEVFEDAFSYLHSVARGFPIDVGVFFYRGLKFGIV